MKYPKYPHDKETLDRLSPINLAWRIAQKFWSGTLLRALRRMMHCPRTPTKLNAESNSRLVGWIDDRRQWQGSN